MPPKRKQKAKASPPKRNLRKRVTPAATPTESDSSSASSPKRKRAKQLESTVQGPAAGSSTSGTKIGMTYDQAEMLRRLITEFDIPRAGLDKEDTSLGVSFSNVKHSGAAIRVGLDPNRALEDISTFEIYRSRIPTSLFKEIVDDLDTMLLEYGPPHVHKNEEAQSRFFSPVFNHLVNRFNFNEPETMTNSRIGTKGRIEYYFKAFGAVGILCIQLKLRIRNEEERLDAIAQVIAECDGCERNNGDGGYSLPVLCILSHDSTFEFFKFTRDRTHLRSSFFRGCFPGDPVDLKCGLTLPETNTMDYESPLPFMLQLRRICETIFDMMLSAYISALKAFHDRSASKTMRKGEKRPRLDAWDQALKSANHAVATLREAENERQKGDIASADIVVLEGFRLLDESTATVSTVYKSKLFMTGWDEDEIGKA